MNKLVNEFLDSLNYNEDTVEAECERINARDEINEYADKIVVRNVAGIRFLITEVDTHEGCLVYGTSRKVKEIQIHEFGTCAYHTVNHEFIVAPGDYGDEFPSILAAVRTIYNK